MAHSSTTFAAQPVAERFWARVDKRGPDECWPWSGAISSTGYGNIRVDGRTRSAVQVAWELANGTTWPSGLDCCHSCDNRCCVNPAHLWPGTRLQNVRDMMVKRRGAGFGAINAGKTHCAKGHPFSGANLYRGMKDGRPMRRCRACADEARRKWRDKKLAALASPQGEKGEG